MEESSATIEYRYKQIENTYLVWIGTINRYIQLEEPAFWIFQQFTSGMLPTETVKGCSERYNLSESEALKFVFEIDRKLKELYSGHQQKFDPLLPDDTLPQTFDSYSEKFIRINDKVIRFTFGSRTLEQFIYPLLSHLECHVQPAKYDTHFELFKFGEMVSTR